MSAPSVADVRQVLTAVMDPELPVVSLEDLGILRRVDVEGERVVVSVTPTYSGCPALAEIEADVRAALAAAGWHDVEVRTVLSPAWSSDDVTEQGRRRLREHGVAPPAPRSPGPVPVQLGTGPSPTCPLCGARDTEQLSRFGATSCQAMWRCRSCRELFPEFRTH